MNPMLDRKDCRRRRIDDSANGRGRRRGLPVGLVGGKRSDAGCRGIEETKKVRRKNDAPSLSSESEKKRFKQTVLTII
jgi:hypothetical protein